MTTETADTTVAAKVKLSTKDEVRALLDRLPDDVTLEDIQYHLDVVVKVLEAEARYRARRGHHAGRVRSPVRKMAHEIIRTPAAKTTSRRSARTWRGSLPAVAASVGHFDHPRRSTGADACAISHFSARMIPEFQDPDRT